MPVSELASHECIPCKGGVPPLEEVAIDFLHTELGDAWQVVENHHLVREFEFKGYAPAVSFTNVVAGIAETQNHHPDILLTWGKVSVTIWTHKIDGLTESDFYFAAKVEEAYTKES
jgi:4a-hydroxytetrahydrobiopterin dehydratase